MTIRVVLADDHAIIREGLSIMLEGQADIQVVGVAANGREAVQLVEEHRPDVLLIDISMPELNGIEVIRRVKPQNPRLHIVVLSIHATKPYVNRALRAGANGYLIKETAGLEVVEAVRAVCRGERYLSERIADMLIASLENNNETSPLDKLTRREREVLQLVAEGKTSHEIGETLGVSSKTVDSYRSRLMSKIGVGDVTGLVKFAIQHGVISLD